jgi:hypothetical protein
MDTKMMIIDQRFNVCQLTKVRGLITNYVTYLQETMNIEMKCPIKKGLITMKSVWVPRKMLKGLSPSFASSANASPNDTKKFELTFSVKVILMIKENKQMNDFLKYIYDDVGTSTIQN